MVSEKELMIKSIKCHAEKFGLLHLPSCSHFSLMPLASIPSLLQCLMHALPMCLRESKARATNNSQLQKYSSVMVGPVGGLASRGERETAKKGLKQCVIIDIFISNGYNINVAGSWSSRANLNQSQHINDSD